VEGACGVGMFVFGLQWDVVLVRLGVMDAQLGAVYVGYEAV
jgi:hypothetical protein